MDFLAQMARMLTLVLEERRMTATVERFACDEDLLAAPDGSFDLYFLVGASASSSRGAPRPRSAPPSAPFPAREVLPAEAVAFD